MLYLTIIKKQTNMCITKTKREIKYYRDIEHFLPYFYNRTIKGSLPDILSNEELLEIYHEDPNFKEWIDKEHIIAKEQLKVRQSNAAITLWTDPQLEESRVKVLEALLRGCVLGGKRAGAKNVESGHIKALGKKWGGINFRRMASEIFVCSVCGYTGSGRNNHTRWHGENCQLPLMEKMFALLPNHFTRKSAKEILKKNNIKESLIDKLTFKDPTYSSWTFISHKGTKDHPYDVPAYSKAWDVDESQKEDVSTFVEKNLKLGKEKRTNHFKKNYKVCIFCSKLQSPGNYVKNGHHDGRCVIPKVKKKTEHQLKKERDLDKVVNFFKDYGWFSTLNILKNEAYFIKKLELTNSVGGLNKLLERSSMFETEISIQPSPAGLRKTRMWRYKK